VTKDRLSPSKPSGDGSEGNSSVAVAECQPGDVLVVATKTPSVHGMFGDLLATLCKARSIAGVILSAGVRDVREIRAMQYPVWAHAVNAMGTAKSNPGWVNVPVTCGGTLVNPGDMIVADDDGVVVVPAEHLDGVIENCIAREAAEAGLRERFAGGELSLDVIGLRPLLERLGVVYPDRA
jgi:4-hydroxy-4-methyl-2-oxoglutarate aldolase